MKLKFLHLALFALLPSCIMAQKKQFTLDDLLPGGKTYYQNSVPENKYLTWWGNECVMLEVDRCYVIDKKTGKESKSMFNLDDINAILKTQEKRPFQVSYIRHSHTRTSHTLWSNVVMAQSISLALQMRRK